MSAYTPQDEGADVHGDPQKNHTEVWVTLAISARISSLAVVLTPVSPAASLLLRLFKKIARKKIIEETKGTDFLANKYWQYSTVTITNTAYTE